jgi:hypothetical protein
MMTNTNTKQLSKADALRAALKTAGYNRRQVSVKHDQYSMGSHIYVTIRDLEIAKSAIESIANSFENVRRDESGEILGGGNTYLTVEYHSESLREFASVVVVPQLAEIADGQSADVLVMGQTIRTAKVMNTPKWNSEIVALDYQTDPVMRVRCYYDPQGSAEQLTGAASRLVELAIELNARAAAAPAHTVEQTIPVVTETDAEIATELAPVLAPSNCQPLPPFPAKAPHLRIVRDEPVAAVVTEDWAAGF